MDFPGCARQTQFLCGDVLAPLPAEDINERQLRRVLMIAGMAVYLVVAFTGLDLLG